MGRKVQSYTLSDVTISRLEQFANANSISKSRAVEKILSRFLLVEAPPEINPADIPYEKPPVIDNVVKLTEEERIADWEWRKKMVNEGKFPTYMADEYPQTIRDYNTSPDVYLTPKK